MSDQPPESPVAEPTPRVDVVALVQSEATQAALALETGDDWPEVAARPVADALEAFTAWSTSTPDSSVKGPEARAAWDAYDRRRDEVASDLQAALQRNEQMQYAQKARQAADLIDVMQVAAASKARGEKPKPNPESQTPLVRRW